MTTTIGRSTSGLFLGLSALVLLLGLGFALVFLKLSPTFVLAVVTGIVAVAISAFRPYVGMHVILALLFFEGAVTPAEGVTALKLFGALLLAGWLAQTLTLRRLRVVLGSQFLLILAFLVWTGISMTRAGNFDAALTRFGTFCLLSVTAVMVVSVVDTPERLRRLGVALVFWTTVTAIIALAWYYGGNTAVAEGLVGNRNILALYINIALAAAFLLVGSIRNALPKVLLLGAMPLLILTLALTLSRTGLVVMIAALTFVGYRLLRQRGVLLLLSGVAAIGLLTFVLPETFWTRANTILPSIERQQDTFGMRVRLWQAGIRMVEDRPVFGVGPGNFGLTLPRYARGSLSGQRLNAHNAYVVVAAEIGLPALAFFLGFVATGAIATHRMVRAAQMAGREDLALGGIMVEAMMFVILCTGITMTVEAMKIFWIVLGLGQAFVGMARREMEGARQPAPTVTLAGEAEVAPV